MGTFPERGAVIANHLSYLDIVVFAALRPVRVCASKLEMQGLAGGGVDDRLHGRDGVPWSVGMAGRRCGRRAGCRQRWSRGCRWYFFRRGRRALTGRQGILKFHSGLLGQMLSTDVGAPVTAAYLRYSRWGRGMGERECTVENDVCYWGGHVDVAAYVSIAGA